MVSRQTDKDVTEVRVYKYGLVPIGYLPEEAISELWRANNLWNSLVVLHNKSRGWWGVTRTDNRLPCLTPKPLSPCFVCSVTNNH